jgi:hypothetical protein
VALEAARSWKGFAVDDASGATVGRARGILVDAESREPVWLLARAGRFGKDFVIPLGDCAAVAGRIWAPYSREALRGAPAVDARGALSREGELEICAHYGIEPGWGRAAQVIGRAEGETTALPA